VLKGHVRIGVKRETYKDPRDAVPWEDWYEEYKGDLESLADWKSTYRDWREFRTKWHAFLDEETLALDMDGAKLKELKEALRAFFGLRIMPTESWKLRILNPQLFVSIEMVRSISTRMPHLHQYATWGTAFMALAEEGYILYDQEARRLYLNMEALAPDKDEALLRDVSDETRRILKTLHLQKELAH